MTMEILNASLLGFFLLLIIYLFYNHKSSGNANLLPAKSGFPLIGETLEFLYAWWKGHSQKFVFDRIAKYSSNDVFKTSLLGSPIVVFSGVNAHRFLLSNENKLVRVWLPRSVEKIFLQPTRISSKEEFLDTAFVRKFYNPAVVQGQIGLMDTIAHTYFETYWGKKDTVVVLPLTKYYTFSLACHLLISVKDPKFIAELDKAFELLLQGIVSVVPFNLPGTPFNRAIKASTFIQKELLEIVKQRKIDLAEGRAFLTQDILSHMLLTSDDNGNSMHEADVATKIFGLLVGSRDNTASACASIVKYLAELPEVYQGVYQEQLGIAKAKAPGELLSWEDIQKMKYSWNVACEVMRLAPPIQGTFREAFTDFSYNGLSISKGCKMYWNVSTHKDDKFFTDPQKFNPLRFEGSGPPPYVYIPFGGGPRICPGKEVARLKILVFMHHLVKRFRWEKLIPDEKIVYIPVANPEKGLPIRLVPHTA